MYSIKQLHNENPSKPNIEQAPSELMAYPTFLTHFFQVLAQFISTPETEMNKIFNLYVVRLKRNKTDVDRFRQLYISSFTEYSKKDNELALVVPFLKKEDRDALYFIFHAKEKILAFYDIGVDKMGTPLETLTVEITDWINLLKSFPFFTNEDLLAKIERFKKHMSEENDALLEVSGLEFLRGTYQFYVAENRTEELLRQRKKETKMTMRTNKLKDDFFFKGKKAEEGLTLAKPALKIDKGMSKNEIDGSDLHSRLKRS